MANGIFIEENGVYQIDCTGAVWASDQIRDEFHAARVFLSDADFVAETEEFLLSTSTSWNIQTRA